MGEKTSNVRHKGLVSFHLHKKNIQQLNMSNGVVVIKEGKSICRHVNVIAHSTSHSIEE